MQVILTTGAAIVLVAFLLYLYLASTCYFTQITFLTAYNMEFKNSGSRQRAVLAGLQVFAGRPPFDQLDANNLQRVSEVFGLVPDPMSVAKIIRGVDRSKDVSRLRDEPFLAALEQEYSKMRSQ